ncbi:forkhead box protein H1 [Fundulus heteroclitus]|uniref:forkhead box protein H1 n=1 Tax=Fundulus heteroclitus TaxID=8078 RepID=UPI00165AA7C2|nr:forkhead box protein H1 [Fundulus heteroclitus]
MRRSDAAVSRPNPTSRAQRAVFKRATTRLAKIALVLRAAPNQMLTCSQLRERLTGRTGDDDKKRVENNIRVCLSSHTCFIKIPMIPDSLNSKKNYWKLDCSQITAKMVRRHFKGLLQLFPELASKLERENPKRPSEQGSAPPSPEAEACRAVQVSCEVKFSGPFSIESLLKRDGPSSRTPGPPHQSGVEQRPQLTNTKRGFTSYPSPPIVLRTTTGSSHICCGGGCPHPGPFAPRAVGSFLIPVHTEPSSAPRLASSQHSYVSYSVPAFSRNTSQGWQ